MPGWRAALEVARWEFWRYIKPKQQLIGMVVTFTIASGFMVVSRLADRGDVPRPHVAVLGADQLPALTRQPGTLSYTIHDTSEEAELRERVIERDLDGLVIIRNAERVELVVRRSAQWTGELRAQLAAARQQLMTQRAGLTPEAMATIMTPPQLDIRYEERSAGQSGSERITLIVILGLMLMAIFMGMSFIFASITGEKQIRVTEQILSAIPAQAWIDGKILGLIGVSIVSVFAQLTSFLVVFVLLLTSMGAAPLALPESLGDPTLVALVFLFAVLGLFFWFAFLGAVAAMIDDPHTSTRGSLLFIPLFASMLAFFVLRNPDNGVSRVLSLLPPTAPSAMPVRLLMVDVSTAEIVISAALLLAGVLVLRVAAGRIFRVAMLMYGKEPTWSEVRRWALGRG